MVEIFGLFGGFVIAGLGGHFYFRHGFDLTTLIGLIMYVGGFFLILASHAAIMGM